MSTVKISALELENIKRINGVCFSVENKVSGIKVYTQIIRSNNLEASEHCNRSFLSGFKKQILAIFL